MDNSRVTLVDHPMVQHKLSILRDKATSCKQFRELVRELALFEGYEATRDLPLADVDVETPICTARCKQVSGKKLAVVPILRAGLGMVRRCARLDSRGARGTSGHVPQRGDSRASSLL